MTPLVRAPALIEEYQMNNEIKLEQWNGYNIRFVDHNGEWWAVMVDLAVALNLRADKIRERLEDDYLIRVSENVYKKAYKLFNEMEE